MFGGTRAVLGSRSVARPLTFEADALPRAEYEKSWFRHKLSTASDGWISYRGLAANGYAHEAVNLSRSWGQASMCLPAIHLVFGLAERWLLGTHHWAVRAKHPQRYLDE
ncbi:MAG: transposase [Pseudomonadota bacterium]